MKVLITGSNRGLGFALTHHFLQKGHTVIAGVRNRNNIVNLTQLKEEYRDKLEVIGLDVSDEESVRQASLMVNKKFDSIDVIINNAGILFPKEENIENINMDNFELTFNVNTFGPIRIIKHFLPLLYKGQDKCIINITSEASGLSNCGTNFISYSSSKLALNMVSEKFNNYLKEKNKDIKVFAVHPGRMKTDMGAENGQIEALETAIGIYNIVTGSTKIDHHSIYIDYLGNPMPI